MDDQDKQDEFDEIVIEDAASEPTGCLGQALAIIVIGMRLAVVLSSVIGPTIHMENATSQDASHYSLQPD